MMNTISLCEECGDGYRLVARIGHSDPCETCGGFANGVYDLNDTAAEPLILYPANSFTWPKAKG